MAEAARKSRYRVDGMDCAGCAQKVDTAVRRIPGVEDVAVSVVSGTMTVEHADGAQLDSEIARRVTRLGYRIAPQTTTGPGANGAEACAAPCCSGGGSRDIPDDTIHRGITREARWWQRPAVQLTLASGLAFLVAYGAGWLLPRYEQWFFGLAMLVGLVPIARRAFAAAVTGTPFSIETLMTIAAVGAIFIGAVQEAAAVIFLFLVGELLEGVAADRSRASIRGLADLVPRLARVERKGGIEEIPAERLSVGDVILVRPGDRIAADGEILSGESSVNEAPVTGESIPNSKGPGDPVFAGTVNGNAALRVGVTAAAEDNTIARVIKLVEEAQEKKAPTERFINRFSRYYTPGVVVLAALVACLPPLATGEPWSEWVYKGLAILLIGCPCALVISTPAAIAAALASGARRGLLMKGGAVLEGAGRLQAIAFDKTGTLTEGKPKVTDIIAFDGDQREVLRLASALEQGSSHPLAAAILERAAQEGIAIPEATRSAAVGGKGVTGTVEGRPLFLGSVNAAGERQALSKEQSRSLATFNDEGKTVSVLLVGEKALGAIAMRDEPREDARSGLANLEAQGIRALMLTGDNRRTAEAIAGSLNIEARAELLPEDKSRIVGELKAGGLKVGKVGDGINDAPALAAADIGIAMGGGTDVALETADAAILHGRVSDVAAMVELSRRTMGNIRQNITIAIGLKVLFFFTTILGITGLWPAILADTGATVLVTANAMRLLGWKPRSWPKSPSARPSAHGAAQTGRRTPG
ncbi:heavy metal translocating P-type ATPase [Chelativorans sp. AA-79]|uniref:heavy metal translocating P-type ATPase n=1 Tax=Chelativorans sp. AA-79 TaxID=3028735 RepID=UPI0023F66686|nr:heavy metal translocating P-type ATPase [Chelativorans sp. AA-79]WEX10150.1 heavy metal translocating P-type ATPase [Chelativorans sp. AA-79]